MESWRQKLKISNRMRSHDRLVDSLFLYIRGITVLTIVLIILTSLITKMLENGVNIYIIDVGQGDCTVVEDHGVYAIIDGGGDKDKSGDNVGLKVILPFLLSKKVPELEVAFVSHTHFDHVKGIIELMEVITINRIVLPKVYQSRVKLIMDEWELFDDQKKQRRSDKLFWIEGFQDDVLMELILTAMKHDIDIVFVEQGDTIEFPTVDFDVLYPLKDQIYDEQENHNSLVMKFRSGSFSMLFTGDAEEEDEVRIMESGADIKSTILKLAHHGSHSSSTEKFLDQVNPKVGVLCYGDNTYGHPSDIIRLRCRNRQIPLYSTMKCGMIEVVISEGQYELKAYRGVLTDETIARPYEE